MATFELTANRWKKVAEHIGLLGRRVEIKVTTSMTCQWETRPGTSGTFRSKKRFTLQGGSLYIKSPVATTLTRTWIV